MEIKTMKMIMLLTLIVVICSFPLRAVPDKNQELQKNVYPSIYVDGKLYYLTDKEIEMEEDDVDKLKSLVSISSLETPDAEGETNLPNWEGRYSRIGEMIAVLYNEEWTIFEDIPEKDRLTFDDYIRNLQKRNYEKQTYIDLLTEESQDYFDFGTLALPYLSEEEQLEIAYKQWGYCLRVNGLLIPKDGIIEVERGPITITTRLKTPMFPMIPNEIHVKGGIPGEYYTDHIDFKGYIPDSEEVLDGTNVQKFTFIFGERTPLEKMEFRISEELKERLHLDTTEIRISVKP